MTQAIILLRRFLKDMYSVDGLTMESQLTRLLNNLTQLEALRVKTYMFAQRSDLWDVKHESSNNIDVLHNNKTYSLRISNQCSQRFCMREKCHPPVYQTMYSNEREKMEHGSTNGLYGLWIMDGWIVSPGESDGQVFRILPQSLVVNNKSEHVETFLEKHNHANFFFYIDKCILLFRIPTLKGTFPREKVTKIYYRDSAKPWYFGLGTMEWNGMEVIYTISNNLPLQVIKYSNCLCHFCILDTLPCHCKLCVCTEYLFIKYPNSQCVYLTKWIDRFTKLQEFCCCVFHFCPYNDKPCYCKTCTFRVDGCPCIRCRAYDDKSDFKCIHLNKRKQCMKKVVRDWLDYTYNELFKRFYPQFYDTKICRILIDLY